MACKTLSNFSREKKKQSTNTEHNEINLMNIINENIFFICISK